MMRVVRYSQIRVGDLVWRHWRVLKRAAGRAHN